MLRKYCFYIGILFFFFLFLPDQATADSYPPTVSILSPSDGKKIYTTGADDYPVKIIFKAWDADNVETTVFNSFVLYWEGTSSGSLDITSNVVPWGPADKTTELYRSYDWKPDSGTYTIQIQATDKATIPNIGKSRKVEITVARTTLNNYSGFPGDGKLLVRDNDNTICMSCHGLKSHSSANIGSTKYGNWERVCRDCHTPHNTRNIFLIQSSLKIYTSINQTYAYSKKVDFRNISGESTYGFVSKPGVPRRGPCEVCHTRTRNTNTTPRWRNYTSEPDSDGKKHNTGLECTSCHLHTTGFSSESGGNTNCSGCHADLFDPMNTADDGYHHMLSNADVDNLSPSGTKYPILTNIVGADPTSVNRRCLMCHVDHDIFRKDLNEKSGGRSYNLRRNISTLPNLSSGVNTDFLTSDSDGGICLSCHKRSQEKSYTQPDGTTNTPVITKALFEGSPHNYVATANFNSSGYTFDANCSKCHIDTISKTKQAQGNQFGPHYSVVRKINAVTTGVNNKGNSGTISSIGTKTLVDTDMGWNTNMWKDRIVRILDGPAGGESRFIKGNSNNTLNVEPDWTTSPIAGDNYLIGISREIEKGLATAATSKTLTDGNASWIPNFWAERPVTIISGTGYGETRQIISNTSTMLNISGTWTAASGSKYSIGDPSEEELCFRCHSEQSNPYAGTQRDFFDERTFENSKVLRMEELFYAKGELHKASNAVIATGLQANTDPGWSTNQWVGQKVRIVAGKGVGQEGTVASNTSQTLTVLRGWTSLNDNTGVVPNSSNFYVGSGNPFRHRMEKYFAKHRSDEAEVAPDGATATGWFNDASNGTHSGCQDCHNPHGNRKGGDDNGTAESGSASHLRDSNKVWGQDKWRGYTLRLMDGNGSGQDRMIAFNTTTSLHVASNFLSQPDATTYYIISPNGTPDRGNKLWNPNSGIWGVDVTYSDESPPLNTMQGPTFTKKKILQGGDDKVYQLCFKCHSEYGWGTEGTPFTIPDSLATTRDNYVEGPTTNIAEEFNPNNLGYHPVVKVGANQPIIAMGDTTSDVVAGAMTVNPTGNNASTLAYNAQWTPNKYNGHCVEVTAGNLTNQIRTIMASDSTSITVDPAFSASPDSSTQFYIRKCSIYNVGATYAGTNYSTPWPRFTGGTIDLFANSSTVTINGLTDGIPATVLRGWYIYVGDLRTGANSIDTPNGGACSATAPCPPMMSTKGWFQIVDIEAGASDAEVVSVDLVVSPKPTGDLSGASYALTAGLGNTFVPPYGPWSLVTCPDCHDTDDSRNPSGPHASSRQWILRTLEAQSFPWYYGGLDASIPTTDAATIKTVAFPDGLNTGWGNDYSYMPNFTCLNCHRPDVYGSAGKGPMVDPVPSGSAFQNYTWQYMSRLPHIPTPTNYSDEAAMPTLNSYGISCMSCHGGDNRVGKSSGVTANPEAALGGIHGSNLGLGGGGGGGGGAENLSYRGRRLLNGAVWRGVTRASTSTGVQCFYVGRSGDSVGYCAGAFEAGNNAMAGGQIANYPYFSGGDAILTNISTVKAVNGPPGVMGRNAGDKVVITFNSETNGDTFDIYSSNIDSVLDLGGVKSWRSGSGDLGGTGYGTWSTVTYFNDTLIITLDDTGGLPSVNVGDTITLNGHIKGGDGRKIYDSKIISGSFDIRLVSATASDENLAGIGIQENSDQVVLLFGDQTAGTAIDGDNIDTALALSNGHKWTEGPLGIYSSAWTSTNYTNDTLTIILNNMTTASAIQSTDSITLGGVINDVNATPITGTITLSGSFDAIPDGVVGFWKLDDTGGTNMTVRDESPLGNDGERVGATNSATGKRGLAYTFDGGNDYIEIAHNSAFDLTDSGSVEFWMNVNEKSLQIYAEKAGVFRVRDMGSGNVGRLRFDWGCCRSLYSDNAYPSGVWHHVVATFGGNYLNLYVNGKQAATPLFYAGSAPINDNPIRLGNNSNLLYDMDGMLDEVLIYNKALTEAEARARYGAWFVSAEATDASGMGTGIQEGDEVIITFDGETNGITIDKDNINSALDLSSDHLWTAGVQGIYSTAWKTVNYTNDTLVITLTDSPTVQVNDTITPGIIIRDTFGRPILESVDINGSFDFPSNIRGYWEFDETGGTTVPDLSSYINHGTLAGGVWTNDSYSGRAIDFSGASSGVTVTDDDDSLDLSTAGSLEVWAKKNSNSSGQMMMAKGNSMEYRFGEKGTSGHVTSRWGQNSFDNYSTDSALPTGGWNHIVMTYDGTDLLYYVNGEPAGGGLYGTDASANTDALWIGHSNGSLVYDGILDEVVVYENAIDLATVQNRYQVKLDSAYAVAVNNNPGIQATDEVVIRFKSPTAGTPVISICADTATIDSVLSLNSGSWGATPLQCTWSNNPHNNDTLTIQLAAGATVGIGDTITLDGSTILDNLNRPVSGSIQIGGTFGTAANEPVNAVGHWKLDTLAATDETANNNDGSLNGTPTLVGGRFGNALRYDFAMTSEYIIVPDTNNSLDLTTKGSLEIWVLGSTNGKTLISKGAAYSLSGNPVKFTWGTSSITAPASISTNEWHHVVGTYDGAMLSLYIDGLLVNSTPSVINATANNNGLTIASSGGNNLFYGRTDEVVVYNRAIDLSEVQARSGATPLSAAASDASFGGAGIQSGDEVVITFGGSTNGSPLSDISTALQLNSGSWGTPSSVTWSDANGFTNNVLTITLASGTGESIEPGSTTITLNTSQITDLMGRLVTGVVTLTGSFNIPPGAVAYWQFDEGTSTTVSDIANTNHGTIQNTYTWTNESYDMYAIDFYGTPFNTRVRVADSNSLDLPDQGTLEVWVKRDSGSTSLQSFIRKGSYNYEMGVLGNTGKAYARWGTNTIDIQSVSVLQPGRWYHIVSTFNGATDVIKLYVNGKLESTTTSHTATVTAKTWIMYLGFASSTYYDGRMDEVLIYDVPLEEGQVEKRYKVKIESATAVDNNSAAGIQSGDQVIIKFRSPTKGSHVDFCTDTSRINTALALNGAGSTWGSMGTGQCAWSTTDYSNDTLTITLGTGAVIGVGDSITLGGGDAGYTVEDNIGTISGRTISDSIQLGGTFGTAQSYPVNAVGHWKLDNNGNDSTVNANDGVVSGGVWSSGQFGQALDLERDVFDNMSVPDSNSLDLTTVGSIEAWVRKESDNPLQTIVSKGSAFSLFEDSSSHVSFQWATGPVLTSNAILGIGQWHHIVGTYDGTKLDLYVDGQFDNSTSHIVHATANSDALAVGHQNGSHYFDGVIDEVTLYNRAISAPDVQRRYGSWPVSAVANDPAPEDPAIGLDDEIIITFSDATNGDSLTLSSDLGLNGGGNWGSSTYAWSGAGGHPYDTLTITLAADTSNIGVGNTITLQNNTIKDSFLRPIVGSVQISGTFGTGENEPIGAVGYWNFDETTSSNANDLTTNNNDGTAQDSTSWFNPGKYDGALDFDGASDYVEMTDSYSLDLTNQGSIELWIYKDSNKNNQVWINKGEAFGLRDDGTTGQLLFWWGSSTNTLSSAAISINAWHHVVATYDGTNMNIYIDKNPANTVTMGSTLDATANSNPVRVGASSTAGDHFDGRIDEVVLYNKALIFSEVEDRYGAALIAAAGSDSTVAGVGLQGGDQVILTFNGMTNATSITKTEIDTFLNITTSSWLDGNSGLGTPVPGWTTENVTSDTLTVTLGDNTSLPDIGIGDTIFLDGSIRDSYNRKISDSIVITGTFDVPVDAVAYWRYDDSGTTVTDETANHLDGTVIPGSTWSAGKIGSGLLFNGDDYVDFPDNAAFALASSYAIEAWIKPGSFVDESAIFYNADGGAFRYNFSLHSDGTIGFSHSPSGSLGSRVLAKSTGTLTLNEWNHVVVTRSGKSSGSTAHDTTFYINGIASGTFDDDHYAASSGTDIWTGKSNLGSGDNFFDGIIDEVVIFNRALSAVDVKIRRRTWMESARAIDVSSGGLGIQANDQIVITFNEATNGPTTIGSNIDSILSLNNIHSWLPDDGGLGGTGFAVWSTVNYTNDTLHVVFNNTTGTLAVAPGDVITLSHTILDGLKRPPLNDTIIISGSFDNVISNATAYWKLDEASGTTVIDGTTKNNHGTITNAVRTSPGYDNTGYAMTFDGSSDYVEMIGTDLSLTNYLKIDFRIKGDGANNVNNDVIIEGDVFKVAIWDSGSGRSVMSCVKTTANWQPCSYATTPVLTTTNWHHVEVTWIGNTTNQISVSIDGGAAEGTTGTSGSTLAATQDKIRLGSSLGGSNFFNGELDEIIIMNQP